MFTSRLIRIIEDYDIYGLHRLNAIKVVYVLFVLFLFNLFFIIPNVYFYYFYVPITSMSAEVIFDHIEDKYKAFIATVLGTLFMDILFNVLRSYPLFFLFFVFLSAAAMYLIALRWRRFFVPLIPIILSLAAYSLLYPDLNMNFYMTLNNAMTTLCALSIVLLSLRFFPLSYYYRLWLRACVLLLQEIQDNVRLIAEKKPLQFSLVRGHTKHLVSFSGMLSRKLPTFSILKINLLVNRLHLESCVQQSALILLNREELETFMHQLRCLSDAVKAEKPCELKHSSNDTLLKLIRTWNYVCLKI